MHTHHIAQINIARIKGVTINDPVMKEFVDNLDLVNGIAEKSKGFVWRLKEDSRDTNNTHPYQDEQVIATVSVWESIEDLENFMYTSLHGDFLKRRKEWFQRYGKVSAALWWTAPGQYPTFQEALDKLAHLQQYGPSEKVFDFKVKFPSPN